MSLSTDIHNGFHIGQASGHGERGARGDERGGRRGHPRGTDLQPVLHDRGATPVRRRRVGDARRGHPELQGGWLRLRAARRGVPRLVVAERDQHRRPEVLPGHARHAAARVLRPPAHRPRRRHDPRLGRAQRLLRHRAGRPGLRRGAHAPDRARRRPRSTRPVWFNVGVPDTPQQCSACFILAVEDHMSSILNWYVEEGTIFKGGSGSGINLSQIRSSKESLAGGGTASGPVSFMRGADASAGTIKSGGKTRRAAKMVILNVDHPDVARLHLVQGASRSTRRARSATPGSTWTSTAATRTRSSTRTRTTPCG